MDSQIAFLIQDKAFDYLDAPIKRVSTIDAPQAYSKALENAQIPDSSVLASALENPLILSEDGSVNRNAKKLSDTMSVGTVVAWHKKKGDLVVNGDILAEIETDKATMELENFDDGVLLDIFVEEGSEAAIGSPLAVVGEEGEEFSELLPSKSDEASTEEDTEKHTDSDNSVEAKEDVEEDNKLVDQDHLKNRSVSGGQRVLASPLAKKIAKEENIDLSSVAGSGPREELFVATWLKEANLSRH